MNIEKKITVPDIGGTATVDVIEILVRVGDEIAIDTPLITLESDKASMEIPSPEAGVIQSIAVALGDKVSEGDLILVLSQHQESVGVSPEVSIQSQPPADLKHADETIPAPSEASSQLRPELTVAPSVSDDLVYAGPGVRRMAYELGVDLSRVTGTGRKSRISKEDVQQYVKQCLEAHTTGAGSASFGLPAMPEIDFSQFGPIERKPLNKIKRLTGVNVHRSWVTIPHVTQFDEADVTDLDAFRRTESVHAEKAGYKLTLLAFVAKVVASALKAFPFFNASLDAAGEELIYKQYCHIGIAVETPNGLVVPVIRDVDRCSVADIAKEMARLSVKAREKGLMPKEMSGGCFTISSLGGIGGTAFTPIVNAPEVAILGLSRTAMRPVYQNGAFIPRLMLPLSLSYDHRVIDGAEAARFTRYIAEHLQDIRKILL